jgi:uncharacterized protein DUF6082
MTIALVSTLISSIALVGVAVSLILQNHQLRTSQLEASRVAQSSLIQMALANPAVAAEVFGFQDKEWFTKAALTNWQVKYWEMSYSIKAISAGSIRAQAAQLFTSEFPCQWWSRFREFYQADATTKREREFFALIDAEFERRQRQVETPPSA